MSWSDLTPEQQSGIKDFMERFWSDESADFLASFDSDPSIHERREVVDNCWENLEEMCGFELDELGIDVEDEDEDDENSVFAHLENYFYQDFLKKKLGDQRHSDLKLNPNPDSDNRWQQ